MTDLLPHVAAEARRLKVKPYLVGGPVRDALLGRPCKDFDIASLKSHALARAVARKIKSKLIVLDETHKIYRLIVPGNITIDIAEQQGKTIQDDLKRRDFTVNAMAQGLDKPEVLDPFGGQRDLRKHVIRALSRSSFVEDPIRLLRAYRFAAQLSCRIEAQTLRWIKAEASRLASQGTVARERIREELLRLLSQKEASAQIQALDQAGLLTLLFPELEAGRNIAKSFYGKGGVLRHQLESFQNLEWLLKRLAAPLPLLGFIPTEKVRQALEAYVTEPISGFARSAILKLAVLLHDVGKPATASFIDGRLRFFGHEDIGSGMALRMTEKLRFSREEGVAVRQWVANHMRLGNLAAAEALSAKAASRYFRDMPDGAIGMILVSLADHYTYIPSKQWGKGSDPVEKVARKLLENYFLAREKLLPARVINGHALMKSLKLKPGPVIGKLLTAIQDGQAEGKIKNASEALAYARLLIKKPAFKRDLRQWQKQQVSGKKN